MADKPIKEKEVKKHMPESLQTKIEKKSAVVGVVGLGLNLPMAKARGFLTGLTQPSRGSFRAQQ